MSEMSKNYGVTLYVVFNGVCDSVLLHISCNILVKDMTLLQMGTP
jgi:hypothetical protein